MKRILVGIDGSPRTAGVLETAITIARAQGAKVTLVRRGGSHIERRRQVGATCLFERAVRSEDEGQTGIRADCLAGIDHHRRDGGLVRGGDPIVFGPVAGHSVEWPGSRSLSMG